MLKTLKQISSVVVCMAMVANVLMPLPGSPARPQVAPNDPIIDGIFSLPKMTEISSVSSNSNNTKDQTAQAQPTNGVQAVAYEQLPADTPQSPSQRAEFLMADDGMTYPVQRYRPLLVPNDPNASQWWTSKIGLNTAWDYAPGSKQTVLAIIDTGFALAHEEFSGRLHENTGEKGSTTQQQPSKLNCTGRGLALDQSCNLIDDDGDALVDNEVGITSTQNRSQLNCSDQGVALDRSCNMVDDDGNGLADDLRGWDFVNFDRSAQAGETNPSGSGTTHGTLVAGTAVATGNNGRGIAGVNWFAKILPLQALDDDSYGDTLTVSRSIRYAADQNADVISISLGADGPDSFLRQAIAYALSKGSIVVAAAGNAGCQCMSYPAAYEEVVAVGASKQDDTPATFSSWGESLDILAPGTAVTTTAWSSSNQTSAYASNIAGTSISTPMVSGLLALARSHQPSASAQQLIASLTEQANRLSIPVNVPRSSTLGYGRADAASVLSRVVSTRTPILRYVFGPVSGGNTLGTYEPPAVFSAYSCETSTPGTTPIYRISRGLSVFYTISAVERYQAIAQGYTTAIWSYACLSLPTDQPVNLRTLSIPREFENREPSK